jgi:hypothetical protein
VKPAAFLIVLYGLLLWLLSGCASAPNAAPVGPLAPPRCYALNADLRRLEPMWLARTPAGHLTLIAHVDYRYGVSFLVTDKGGYIEMSEVAQYVANAMRMDVDVVQYAVPITAKNNDAPPFDGAPLGMRWQASRWHAARS